MGTGKTPGECGAPARVTLEPALCGVGAGKQQACQCPQVGAPAGGLGTMQAPHGPVSGAGAGPSSV